MTRDFQPSASIETLRARSELLKQTRDFFLERGFFETDTPALSHDTVVDRFIDPIKVQVQTPGKQHECYLQTSPEFAMKRLLASGAEAIFYLGKAFRQGEAGDQHQPEFTMLEWYRVGDNYQQGRALLDEFAQSLLGVGPARQISYGDLFEESVGINPLDQSDEALKQMVQAKLKVSTTTDRDELLNLLMSQIVEPQLSKMESVIIYDWPATQSALARTRKESDSVEVAERFELYVRGVELANGYHELTDADELRNRNRRINQQRESDGSDRLPEDSRLLDAMDEGLPECSGTALGFDRLAMLRFNKRSIAEVVPFDFNRA